jgi:hypothetical protein
MLKTVLCAALAAALAGIGLAARDASRADDGVAADAVLTLSSGAVAAGASFASGSGQLDYMAQPHSVRVSGLSAVDSAAAKTGATALVYNLKALKDFDGIYRAFDPGATVVGGVAYLKNQKGVVIKLNTASTDLCFKLSASGVTLKVQS